jgi:hypothetical protein
MKTAKFAIFLLTIAIILTSCAGDAGSTNEVERLDFVQDIASGTIEEKASGEGYILSFDPSAQTTWFAESPGSRAGSLHPYTFFSNFHVLFGPERPNSILAIRTEEGELVSYAIEISDPVVNSETGIVQCSITELETAESASSLGSLQELKQFGPATLFIDSGGQDGTSCTADKQCDTADLYFCNVLLNICMDGSDHGNNGAACSVDRDCWGPEFHFCADGVCTSVDPLTDDAGQ